MSVDLPAGSVREIAHVERLLRADDRAIDPVVRVSQGGVRISWLSHDVNEHARGSLTATVCNEIAATDAWGLSTVHDPQGTGGSVQSMLTVVYDGERFCDLCSQNTTAGFKAPDYRGGTFVCGTHANALENGDWEYGEHWETVELEAVEE